MCKIFTLTNATKIKKMNRFIEIVAAELQYHEQDGFGYSIQGEQGVYGERTTAKDFNTMMVNKALGVFPFLKNEYNRYGNKSKITGAAMFHGRTSTNKKDLINTHPIIKHGWNLIHNGVVSNTGKDYTRITSNDTEHLVEYMATLGIKGVEENLTGYYAFTAIDPSGQLHIVKDSAASLYFAEVMTIDSYVFATSKQMIIDVCKKMNWKHSVVESLKDNMYLVYNNNVLISQVDITPKGRTAYEDKWSNQSLGYNLGDKYDDYNYKTWDNHVDYTEGKGPELVPSIPGPSDELDEDSIDLFLEEVNTYADSSYTFKDYACRDLTYSEFIALEDEEKICCTVIRSDGTVVDPDDYYTETLYQGAM
jgi:predicted glutamine amidotransferase